jgi:anti-sigma B factor antagonist
VNFEIEDQALDPTTTVLNLRGEVDLYAAPELKRHVDGAIRRGKRRVILDLSDATFIDSTTLGIMVGGMKRLRPAGGALSVICPNPGMAKLFEITGLNRVFRVYETREEALLGAARERGSPPDPDR